MTKENLQIRPEDNPSHVAWHVDKSGAWTPIGAAWPHVDGKGFMIQINTKPPTGTIVLRTAHVNLN